MLFVALTAGALLLATLAGRLTAAHANARFGWARARVECAYELPDSQSFLLRGFLCPSSSCSDDLLRCHCTTAHEVKTLVKDYLLLGRSPDEIRWEIRSRYGSELDPPEAGPTGGS